MLGVLFIFKIFETFCVFMCHYSMEKLQILKTISTREVLRNKWWRYFVDEYKFPDGSDGEYHFVRTSGSTMTIAKLSETSFVLTRQYRYLNRRISLEFPGGGIKEGLEPETNAREELTEEAGYEATEMIKLGIFNPFNGVTDEICHVFLALGLTQVEARPEPSEEFEIVTLSKQQINEYIQKGELWDGMTLASWALYLSKENQF